MVNLVLGNSYLSRNSELYQITKILTEEDDRYADGFRFEGICHTHIEDRASVIKTSYLRYFTNEGKNFSITEKLRSTPSDLIFLYKTQDAKIKATDLFVGQPAGEIVDTVVEGGPFGGWVVHSSFPIDYVTQMNLLNNVRCKTCVKDDLAFIVSVTKNDEDIILSVLMYHQDRTKAFLSTITRPDLWTQVTALCRKEVST